MTSPDSNRNDPNFVKYYQNLADIIRIFWEFHKIRLSREEMPLTGIVKRDGQLTQYKLQESVDWRGQKQQYVIHELGNLIQKCVEFSWWQFIGEKQQQRPLGYEALTLDPYVMDLLKETEALGKKYLELMWRAVTLSRVL